MSRTSRQQWDGLWQRLTGAQPPSHLYHLVIQRYAEPGRAYHTRAHIDDCLEQLVAVQHLASAPNVLAMAIWLHDIIYDPRHHDNEEASAEWATSCFATHEVPTQVSTVIERLILATAHGRSLVAADELPADAPLLLDIDLAILGAPRTRFATYEQEIRQEYAWVPIEMYCEKRAALLRQFLTSETIYQTPYFQQHLEALARENLAWLIQRLEDG